MPLDLVQPATDGLPAGVPGQGVFEPEVGVAAQVKSGVKVGADSAAVP